MDLQLIGQKALPLIIHLDMALCTINSTFTPVLEWKMGSASHNYGLTLEYRKKAYRFTTTSRVFEFDLPCSNVTLLFLIDKIESHAW
jgi:hypothetical protein